MNKKLYNVIFPIWMLLLFPTFWLVSVPANFIIDTIVLVVALMVTKVGKVYEIYMGSILKVWLLGFVADIVGALLLIGIQFLPISGKIGEIVSAVAYNPFRNVFAILIVIIAIAISAFAIYWLNMRYTFKNQKIEEKSKKKICVILAICTAPYLFFYPTEWMYQVNTNGDLATKSQLESEFSGDTITTRIFAESKNYTKSDFLYMDKIANVDSDIVSSTKGSVVNMKISTNFEETTDMNEYKKWAKQCSFIVFIKQPEINEVVVNLKDEQTKDINTLTYSKQEMEKEYQVETRLLEENADRVQEILNSMI